MTTFDELDAYLEQLQRMKDEAKRETSVPQETREKIERLQEAKTWVEVGKKK